MAMTCYAFDESTLDGQVYLYYDPITGLGIWSDEEPGAVPIDRRQVFKFYMDRGLLTPCAPGSQLTEGL